MNRYKHRDWDLARMSDEARTAWMDVWQHGCEAGWQLGYEAANAEMEANWARAREIVLRAANALPYDELAELRGEHARAERQREILHERGIVQWPR